MRIMARPRCTNIVTRSNLIYITLNLNQTRQRPRKQTAAVHAAVVEAAAATIAAMGEVAVQQAALVDARSGNETKSFIYPTAYFYRIPYTLITTAAMMTPIQLCGANGSGDTMDRPTQSSESSTSTLMLTKPVPILYMKH